MAPLSSLRAGCMVEVSLSFKVQMSLAGTLQIGICRNLIYIYIYMLCRLHQGRQGGNHAWSGRCHRDASSRLRRLET